MDNIFKIGSPVALNISWLSYLSSKVFTMQFLNEIALFLSVLASIVYIVTSLHKFFKNYE